MFAGRKKEIKQLLGSFSRTKGTLNVIRGRRRIGKTRLIKELPNFGKNITLRYLTSSPPTEKVSDSEERKQYAEQVKAQFDLSYMPPHATWRELLAFISDLCSTRRTILAIDEINWLATKSPAFMSVFFELWENQFTLKKEFMIILSGSLSSWIEDNILMNKGFVGRISVSITLKELALNELPDFFGSRIRKTPDIDLIKMLSAVGAVPRYLEELDLTKTAEANLNQLAFNSSGFLYNEFEKMFYDLFSKENRFYRSILETISQSKQGLTAGELAEKMGLTYSGRHTQAIDVLEEVGFIKRQHTWDIAKRKPGKKYALKISDNYTALYFRAIAKTKAPGKIQPTTPANLPSLLGLQFENLVHNNILFILKQLHLNIQDIAFAAPYLQTTTTRRQGCQIDLLIQAKNRVYVCECKLHSGEITRAIIPEVQAKISKLPKPKGISFHPVLIHGNRVAESVIEEDYFDRVINLADGTRL
ncbi:AAA family ATPase [Endozoicomonas euniceicola]|uniref:ATP-binding protein n=1 Tax=Endozoicomonas euniceicola TaxID=1234143 RepID=A0ABY6GTI0_9GAMM|nr:ATP-binding protein [Endozoicomonas euniceicola]UYM15699.1 ATP-binding protein [Endozoicomonas euniceicola]